MQNDYTSGQSVNIGHWKNIATKLVPIFKAGDPTS